MRKNNSQKSVSPSRYIVVGDVHGDLNQFLRPLIIHLSNPENSNLIYLGDYFDRGDSDVYIFEILKFILEQRSKIDTFKNIHFLRGNHECYNDGTTDAIGELNNNKDGPIVSFITSEAMKLDLDLFYYDSSTKILFSHSPYSVTPLNELLKSSKIFRKDPELAASLACSNEGPIVDYRFIKYLNIHGHDHNISSFNKLNAFFETAAIMNGARLKNPRIWSSISLDAEATYGARIHDNVMHILNGNFKKCEKPYTNLTYLMFEIVAENGSTVFKNANLYNEKVYLYSERDYNTKSFGYIRDMLANLCPIFDQKSGEGLNLQKSSMVFLNRYKSMIQRFNDQACINEMNSISENLETLFRCVYRAPDTSLLSKIVVKISGLDRFGGYINIPCKKMYFNNVPYEIYKACEGGEYDFAPTWELFWRSIKCGGKVLSLLYGIDEFQK